MKKKVILITCLFLSSFAFAKDTTSANAPLHALFSKELPLTIENIACGLPIHAYMAGPSIFHYGNNFEHVGRYIGATVYTRVSRIATDQSPTQEIIFHNIDDSYHVLNSSAWEEEILNGEVFIVFHYPGFKVHSSLSSQFVIGE